VPSIRLSPGDRNTLLGHYRRDPDPQVRLRAHILLLLAGGHPWATVAAVLFTSPATIARWRGRFDRDGAAAVLGGPRGRKRSAAWAWAAVVAAWVLARRPSEFGLARSRWSCEAAAVVLHAEHGVAVGRETVRRWLRDDGLVWRRPRPVLRPKDPERERKLAALRALLHGLPDDETAVFMDEVDINLNPEVGAMWMRRGEQAALETPGANDKRYLAGSIHWRTGRVVLTGGLPGEGRSAALFCRHLDDLRGAFRRYRVVHVVCDNARTHKPEGSRVVKEYLAEWGGRVVLHFLPSYAPECNPIERVWWRLREAVTRNHRCETADELLDLTFEWFAERGRFRVQCSAYEAAVSPLPQLAVAI
jgi:putative transposase